MLIPRHKYVDKESTRIASTAVPSVIQDKGLAVDRTGLASPAPWLSSQSDTGLTWFTLEVLRESAQSQVGCSPESEQAKGF